MDKKEVTQIIVKAGLNCIPVAGGGIASILDDYLAIRKEERLREFLNNFANDMSEKNEKIIKEYVQNEEFLDIFENILSDNMKTRSIEKREMLKNLLVNSCIIEGSSYEKTEEFQHLIDVMSITSLLILNAFYELKDIKMDADENNINKIWDKIILNTGVEDKQILLDYVGELENRNLIGAFSNNFFSIKQGIVYESDGPYITPKGLEFYKYIIKN